MTVKLVLCVNIVVEGNRSKKFEMNKKNWGILIAIVSLNNIIFP